MENAEVADVAVGDERDGLSNELRHGGGFCTRTQVFESLGCRFENVTRPEMGRGVVVEEVRETRVSINVWRIDGSDARGFLCAFFPRLWGALLVNAKAG